MNKEQIIQDLIKNPKYDSDWVNKAAELMTTYGLSQACTLAKYNAQQLDVLLQAYKTYGADGPNQDLDFIDLISNPELNVTQMQILFTVKVKGNIDNRRIRILADPEIAYAKSNYISQAMIDGFFMAEIIDVKSLDAAQIYEIYCGWKSEINYAAYADINISAEHMGLMRHAMEVGFTVTYDPDSKGLAMFPPTAAVK